METTKIQLLRQAMKMSQREFSNTTGIPLGTLRNWEQGLSEPPQYVYNMVIHSVRRDLMINIETVKFIQMLNELTELMENGVAEFSEATQETLHTKLFYDKSKIDENDRYPIVLDACLIDDPDSYHHDVISYYESYVDDDYTVRVDLGDPEEGEEPYLEVSLAVSDESVVVQPGRWYFA